jgi:hypothetical protein
MFAFRGWVLLTLGAMSFSLLACRGQKSSTSQGQGSATPPTSAARKQRTLTLGAYTTPREPYGKALLPAFQKK